MLSCGELQTVHTRPDAGVTTAMPPHEDDQSGAQGDSQIHAIIAQWRMYIAQRLDMQPAKIARRTLVFFVASSTSVPCLQHVFAHLPRRLYSLTRIRVTK